MNGRNFAALAGALVSLGAHDAQAGTAGTPFVAADVYALVDVADPAFSPDGAALYYATTAADRARDETQSDLWRVPFAGGAPRRLTHTDDRSEWSPRPSADGKTLYFLADDADGTAQIFAMPAGGGRARRLTRLEADVEAFDVAPDGRLLALAEAGGPKDNAAGTPAPIVVDAYVAMQDGRGHIGPARRQIFLVDSKTGAATQLTRMADDVSAPSFSPDGTRVAFSARGGAEPDRAMNYDVYVVEARAGAEPRAVTQAPTADGDPDWGGPRWSPDGRRIVYARTDWPAHGPYAQATLAVVDLASGAETGVPSGDRWEAWPQWSADGSKILAVVETPHALRLAAIDPASGDAAFLSPDRATVYGYAVAPTGAVAVLRGDKTRPNELFALDGRPLTRANAWIDGRAQGEVREIAYKSADGTEIRGLMMTPPGWDGRPAPTLFALHGGPVWQWQHEFDIAWQTYAAAGYAVVGVNPRGSSGRGQAFAEALRRDWGGVETADVRAGVDWAIREKIADPARLGVYGWSWGGILANYVIASDPRFAAAISGAGMGNFLAAYGTDQYAVYYDAELGAPFENEALWRRLSYPFFNARKIRTPTLYQCAGDDRNVPCLGAEQMYSALRRVGTPTRLVVFPGETHTLSTPSYLEQEILMDVAWFDRWMRAGPADAATTAGR